ncbi:MAG: double-strand break repair protein AddB, partial [Pseudomonadota bacterium]
MTPGLYYLPPGADFGRALALGLRARFADRPPQDMARLRLFLNAQRTRRRVIETLEAQGEAAYLPRLALVSSLEEAALAAGLPGWAGEDAGLRRPLTLSALVQRFVQREPAFGAAADAPALALSLQTLMDELDGAGVPAAALQALEAGEHAEHWDRTRRFLEIVTQAWPSHRAEAEAGALDPEARRLAAAQAVAAAWADAPPGPVMVAGSTGSTLATATLMAAAAAAPEGVVLLPGWDPEMPDDVWRALADGETPEHPHHAEAAFLRRIGASPADLRPWDPAAAPSPRRRFLCEALRPAPVTDAWAASREALGRLAAPAAEGLALIEAQSPREEAEAAACLLAAEALEGGRAALITPDRALARRVTAELARWGLDPDDSAGRPLGLTPPGIFLGLLAGLPGRPLGTATLAAILRHPLCGGAAEARATHSR